MPRHDIAPDQPAFPLTVQENDVYSHDGMTLRQYAAVHIAAGVEASLTTADSMKDEAFAAYVWRRVDALFRHQQENDDA